MRTRLSNYIKLNAENKAETSDFNLVAEYEKRLQVINEKISKTKNKRKLLQLYLRKEQMENTIKALKNGRKY